MWALILHVVFVVVVVVFVGGSDHWLRILLSLPFHFDLAVRSVEISLP